MYYADFDGNGSTETILCNYKNEAYYPLLGLDELASQIVSLRKKFTSYKSFAGKSIDEIFEKSVLKKARILEVHTLASGYLKMKTIHLHLFLLKTSCKYHQFQLF